MAYTPFTWKDGNAGGTPFTAARFNAIEQGIADAHATADAATTGLAGKAPLARGIPAGGGAGQLLVKNSSADYAAGWQDPNTTVASHTHGESDVTNLSSDLAALRTSLYGGSARTRPPTAAVYFTTDSASLAGGKNWGMVAGWAKAYDLDNMVTLGFTNDANPTEITAPVAGMYLIWVDLTTSAQSGYLYWRWILNGTNTSTNLDTVRVPTQTLASATAVGAEATHLHAMIVRPLAAGDRIQGAFWSTVPFVLKASWFGGARHTQFGMRYLGPVT